MLSLHKEGASHFAQVQRMVSGSLTTMRGGSWRMLKRQKLPNGGNGPDTQARNMQGTPDRRPAPGSAQCTGIPRKHRVLDPVPRAPDSGIRVSNDSQVILILPARGPHLGGSPRPPGRVLWRPHSCVCARGLRRQRDVDPTASPPGAEGFFRSCRQRGALSAVGRGGSAS